MRRAYCALPGAGALLPLLLISSAPAAGEGTAANRLELRDIFELELATGPQLSSDGGQVVYVRNSMDVMSDRRRSRLWIVDLESGDHRPLSSPAGRDGDDSSPRSSPDRQRLLYVSRAGGSDQLLLRLMDTGQTAELTHLDRPPPGVGTPRSESEPYYHALKLRRLLTALVRIPEASHGIAERPSHLMAKVNCILGWMARHGGERR